MYAKNLEKWRKHYKNFICYDDLKQGIAIKS